MSYLEETLSKASSKKSWLPARIDAIKRAPDGARRWLRDLGKNDFEHAEAVEDYVEKLLIESNVSLSLEETYLLLHSIYVHDVGYRIEAKNHAQHTYDMITTSPESFFIYDENLSRAIALTCLTHGVDDINNIPTDFPIDFVSKTMEFDLRFLGSLLLLADELDQGYLRVFNRPGQERSLRNNVYHVQIGPQIAKLKTRPDTQKDWDELRKVADHMQVRLDGIHEVLVTKGIKLEQISLYPKVWAVQSKGKEKPRPHSRAPSTSETNNLLFLLDRSVFGTQVLQHVQAQSRAVTVLPIHAARLSGCSVPIDQPYSGIVWMLGEDFSEPLSEDLLELIVRNTQIGGALVVFPFVAWSVSQGINDRVDEVLPVTLRRGWSEGERQRVSFFLRHAITRKLGPFEIENTSEWLEGKPEAESPIKDSGGNPFLTLGSYGAGRVAYLNICSHLCWEPRVVPSPWQQSKAVRDIIARTIDWALAKTHGQLTSAGGG